jgi:hypothetical protein
MWAGVASLQARLEGASNRRLELRSPISEHVFVTSQGSGSGRFSDYPRTKNKAAEDGSAATGGTSGVDRCQQAFHAVLEDVANCDFYAQSRTVPTAGDQLGIVFDSRRLFAVDTRGVKVGALPTSFNYLVACMASGVEYVGVVGSSDVSPVPTVGGDFAPKPQ